MNRNQRRLVKVATAAAIVTAAAFPRPAAAVIRWLIVEVIGLVIVVLVAALVLAFMGKV